MTRTKRLYLPALMFLIPLIAFSGCSIFASNHDDLAKLAPSPDAPGFTVEFRPESGKRKQRRLPLHGELYLSDVLEKVNAGGRYEKAHVSIERQLPNGRTVRMGVQRSGKGALSPQYDYAIHSGDRVVLTENTNTMLDEMLSMLPDF